MIEFASLSSYKLSGRGTVYAVSNPTPVQDRDFSWLIGREVLLDGRVVKVAGVESFAMGGLYAAGRPIGILVKET